MFASSVFCLFPPFSVCFLRFLFVFLFSVCFLRFLFVSFVLFFFLCFLFVSSVFCLFLRFVCFLRFLCPFFPVSFLPFLNNFRFLLISCFSTNINVLKNFFFFLLKINYIFTSFSIYLFFFFSKLDIFSFFFLSFYLSFLSLSVLKDRDNHFFFFTQTDINIDFLSCLLLYL